MAAAVLIASQESSAPISSGMTLSVPGREVVQVRVDFAGCAFQLTSAPRGVLTPGPRVAKAEADKWLPPTRNYLLTKSVAGTPQRIHGKPAGNRCPVAELQAQAIKLRYSRWKIQSSNHVIIDWQQRQLDEALVLALPSVGAHAECKSDRGFRTITKVPGYGANTRHERERAPRKGFEVREHADPTE
jgi:hypothetical protein